MTTGEKIKEKRINKNISQETLAEAVGVNRSTISQWENGSHKPNAFNIAALSAFFGCPADELLESPFVLTR